MRRSVNPISTPEVVNSNNAQPQSGNLRRAVSTGNKVFPSDTQRKIPAGLSIDEAYDPARIDQIYASSQTGYDKAFNAIVGGVASGGLTAVEDLSYLAQTAESLITEGKLVSDWERNIVAETMQELKKDLGEALPIYGNPMSFWNGLKSVLDSSVGFAIPGAGIVKGIATLQKLPRALQLVTRAKRARAALDLLRAGGRGEQLFNSLASGVIQNHAEGMMMGMEVYETTLDKLMQDNPNATPEDIALFEETASNAADRFLVANRAMILSDAFGLHGIYQGKQMVRNLRNAPGWQNRFTEFGKSLIRPNADNLILQNAKEGAEEIYQSIQQKEQQYQALKEGGFDTTGYDPDNLNRIWGFLSDPATLYEGLLGFVGGGAQRILTELAAGNFSKSSRAQRQAAYDQQQEVIKVSQDYLSGRLSEVRKVINFVEQAGDDSVLADVTVDKHFINLAVMNFEAGTTEMLEEQLNDIIKNKEGTFDEQAISDAKRHLEMLSELENEYIKYNKYENSNAIFSNRQARKLLDKYYADVNTKRTEALAKVQTLADSMTEGIIFADTVDGVIKEVPMLLDLTSDKPKGANDFAINKYNKAYDELKNTEEYKEFDALNKSRDNVLNKRRELDSQYKELTSPNTQVELYKARKENEEKVAKRAAEIHAEKVKAAQEEKINDTIKAKKEATPSKPTTDLNKVVETAQKEAEAQAETLAETTQKDTEAETETDTQAAEEASDPLAELQELATFEDPSGGVIIRSEKDDFDDGDEPVVEPEEEPVIERPVDEVQMLTAYEPIIRELVTPWDTVESILDKLRARDAEFSHRYDRTDKAAFNVMIEKIIDEETASATEEEVAQDTRDTGTQMADDEVTSKKEEAAKALTASEPKALLPAPPKNEPYSVNMIYRAAPNNEGVVHAESREELENWILDNFFFDDRILDPNYMMGRKVKLKFTNNYRNGKKIKHTIYVKGQKVKVDQDVLKEYVSDEEFYKIAYVGVYNEQDELLGFIHSPATLKDPVQKQAAMNTRRIIFEKGSYDAVVDGVVEDVSAGPIARVPIASVNENMPDATLLLSDGDKWISDKPLPENIPVVQNRKGIPIPVSELKGVTFTYIETHKGPILVETYGGLIKDSQPLVDMLAKAVETFFNSTAKENTKADEEFRDAIKKEVGLDIYTLEGLRELFNLYVFASDKGIYSKMLKRSPNTSGVGIWTDEDGQFYIEYGIGGEKTNSINSIHTKAEQLPNILKGFKQVIGNLRYRVAKEHLINPNKPFKVLGLNEQGSLVDLNEGGSYRKFVGDKAVFVNTATITLSTGAKVNTINNVITISSTEVEEKIEEEKSQQVADIERRIDNTISKIFGSNELFDFSEDQPGEKVRGEFIPDNLGEQIFNAINKTIKGEVQKVDKDASKILFKDMVKKMHPDKHPEGTIQQIIAEKFFKAASIAKDKGYIDVLKEINAKYDAELAALESQPTTQLQTVIAELFESNPKLANAVYEALGFNQETNLQDTWINYVIKKDNISKKEVLQRLETHKTKLITVYRGEGSTVNLENSNIPDHIKNSKGRWFTKDKKVAQQYAEMQKGSLYALQIPEILFDNISKELNLQNTNGVEALLPQELVNEKVKLSIEITPEQKQQAQQAYAQYLDTIFPDSKVKDIVYHVDEIQNKEFDKEKGLYGVFYFDLKPRKQHGEFIYTSLIDVKNPEIVPASVSMDNIDKKTALQYQNKGVDSIIGSIEYENLQTDLSGNKRVEFFNKEHERLQKRGYTKNDTYELIVFEPEQIHILGSKQDIAGFKRFVNNSNITQPQTAKISESDKNEAERLLALRNKKKQQSETEEYEDYSPDFESKELEQSLLIDGLTSAEQTQLVDYIAAQIAEIALDSPTNTANDSDVAGVFNELFKTLKTLAPIHTMMAKMDESFNSEIAGAKVEAILENKEFLEKLVKNKLSIILGGSVREDADVIDADNTTLERKNYDEGFSFTLNPKDTAGAKLKFWLMRRKLGIPSDLLDSISLEIDRYVPYDHAFETLSEILAGQPADWDTMMHILNKNKNNLVWLKNVYSDLIKVEDEQLKHQFVVAMTKRNTSMKKAALRRRKTKAGEEFFFNVIDENSQSVTRAVLDKWSTSFQNNFDLFTLNEDGTRTLDTEALEKLKEDHNKLLIKLLKNEATLADINTFLKNFGINMSPKVFKMLTSKNDEDHFSIYRSGELTKMNLAQIFQGSGPFSKKMLIERLLDENDITDEFNLFEDSIFYNFAKYVGKFDPNMGSNSFRVGDKSIYSYRLNNLIAERVSELKDPVYAKSLMNKAYNKYAGILSYMYEKKDGEFVFDAEGLPIIKDQTFYDLFQVHDLSLEALKDLTSSLPGNEITNLDEGSHELMKVILFQGASRRLKHVDRRVANILLPTFSDKSAAYMLETYVEDIELDNDGEVADKTLELIYQRIVRPEAERIKQAAEATHNIKSYDAGAKLFYAFPELNDRSKFPELYDNGILKPMDTQTKQVIKRAIKEHFRRVIDNKMLEWQKHKIANKYNKNYINAIKAKMPGHARNNPMAVLRYAAADFEINYMLTTADAFKVFHGDPALYYKVDSKEVKDKQRNKTPLTAEDYVQMVKDTFTNIGKRLAADIAPGQNLSGDFSDTFKVVLLPDRVSKSTSLAYYTKLGINGINDYKAIEGTDAQEFTTFLEHLNVLFRSGKLPFDVYTRAKEKYHNWITKEQRGEKLTAEDYISKADLNLILQPMKPVYTNNVDSQGTYRRIYIKSSSVPLLPQLTQGLEIDKLRRAMERDNIQRAAFGTAFKVGAPASAIKGMWAEDGSINEDALQFTDSESVVMLPRKGFRIQQEIPNKEELVNSGSQERKLLFNDLLHIPGMRELKESYNATWDNLYDLKKRQLLESITDNNGKVNFEKLHKLMQEEAIARQWPINDQAALEVINGKFSLPLWSLQSRTRIEALLNSIVDNRIRKIKFPGKSFVLATEEGFMQISGKSLNDSGIKFNKFWQGRLTHTSSGKQTTDVIVPWKFKDNNGKKISIPLTAEGYVDTEAIGDEELSRIFGFRIPTQGLNSMANIRVVGYLPPEMGDVVIASRDFTKQMGSDFDIDKLYSYRKYYYQDKYGKLRIVNDDTQAGDLPSSMQSKLEEMQLVNRIIDFHYQVMDNPNPEIQKRIAEPLSFQELKKTDAEDNEIGLAKKHEDLRKQGEDRTFFSPLSSSYQRDKLINATAGKAGVGVFSLDSVFNAMIQGRNVEILDFSYTLFGLTTTGDLSNPYVLSGNGRTKSDVISGYQSAAVDNEKEQVLDKLNINKHTFAFIRAMNQLGYEERHVAAILNQPVVRDYVEFMSRQESPLVNERITDQDIIFSMLMEKYPALESDYVATVEEFEEAIVGDRSIPYFNNIQATALSAFMDMKKIGTRLGTLQGLMNTDSAGVGKNMIHTFTKYNDAKLAAKQRIKLGEEKFEISNIDSLVNPESETPVNEFSSMANRHVLKTAYDLFSEFFPYASPTFRTMLNQVSKVSEEDFDSSLNQKTNNRTKLFGHFMSYLYTGYFEYKPDLLFDSKDNPSLGQRILELQQNPEHRNNKFLKKLKVRLGKGIEATTITVNATKEDSAQELDTHIAFMELLIDEDTKAIAEDLIAYTYITGGHQQATQFTKYIPVKHLINTGFADYMNNLDFNNPAKLLNYNPNLAKDIPFYKKLSGFTIQYAQHNPWVLPQNEAIDPKQDIITDEEVVSAAAPISAVNNVDPSGKSAWYVYVKTDINGRPALIRTDKLGARQLREYNMNEPTSVNTKFDKTKNAKVPPADVHIDRTLPKMPITDRDDLPDFGVSGQTPAQEILENIITSAEVSAELKAYAQELLELGLSDEIGIKFNDDLKAKGRTYGNRTTGKATIEVNKSLHKSAEALAETLLHEMTHAITAHQVRLYENDKSSVSPKIRDSVEKLIQLIDVAAKAFKDNERELSMQMGSDDFQRLQYALGLHEKNNSDLSGVRELIAMARTNPATKEFLSTTIWQGKKTLLDRLLELLSRIWKDLGIKKGDDVTKGVLSEIKELAQYSPNIKSPNLDVDNKSPLDSKKDIADELYADPTHFAWKQAKEREIGLRHPDNNPKRYIKYQTAKKRLDAMRKKHPDLDLFVGRVYGEKGDQRLYYSVLIKPLLVDDLPAFDMDERVFADLESVLQVQSREVSKQINEYKQSLKDPNLSLEEKQLLFKQMEILSIRREHLNQSLKDAKSIQTPRELAPFAEKHLSEVEEIIAQDNINASELQYANKMIHLWQAAGKRNFRPDEEHIFLTKEELENDLWFDGDSTFPGFNHYLTRANKLKNKLANIERKLVGQFVKKYTKTNLTDDEIFGAITDAYLLSAMTLDISRHGDPMLNAIFIGIKSKIKAANLEYDQRVKEFSKLIKVALPELKRLYPGKNPYEIFLQKDEEGNYTGGLVYPFSQAFFDARSRLRANAKKSQKAYDKYVEWKQENLIIMDPRILFEDKELYPRQTYSNDVRERHIAELKAQMGEKLFNFYYQELQNKLSEFKAAYLYKKESLSEADFELWNMQNSPYWYARLINDKNKLLVKNKQVRSNGWEYTVEVPRKTDTSGKTTKWYDEAYEEIQSNEAIRDLFDFMSSTLIEMTSFLPPHITKDMRINTLPDLEASWLEEVTNSNFAPVIGMKRIHDDVKRILRSEDNLQQSNQPLDPLTKQQERLVHAQNPSLLENKATQLLNIEKAAYKGEHGKNMPLDMQIKRKKAIVNELTSKARRSLDLEKILRGYIASSTLFKHKSMIQDEIKLMESAFMTRVENETNSVGDKVKDGFGRDILSRTNLANYKSMLQYHLDHFYNLPTEDIMGKSDKKILTSEEQSIKESITEAQEKLNQARASGLITEEEYNYQSKYLDEQLKSLGGVFTGSGLINLALRYIHLKGMGWNLFSAFSNMGFGLIANLIEAADGRTFTQKQYWQAMNIVKGAVLKNGTFNKVQTDNAKKVRSIMDKYDFLKTSKNEVYKSQLHNQFEKARFMAPYNLTDRTEYLNQAPVVVAMMLNTKITNKNGEEKTLWDAYDINGEFKVDEFGTSWLVEQKGGSPSNEITFSIKVDQAIKRIHGNYDPDSPLLIKKTALGRAAAQFRTWLFEGMANRFDARTTEDTAGGITRKGRFVSAYQLLLRGDDQHSGLSNTIFTLKQLTRKLASAIPFVNMPTEFDKRFNELDAANMRANLQELVIYGTLLGVALLLKGMMDDDDMPVINLLLNQLNRLQTDIAMYLNPITWTKTVLNDPIPGVRIVSDLYNVVDGMAGVLQGTDEIKNGPYAGESKFFRSSMKFVPFGGQVSRFIDASTQVY